MKSRDGFEEVNRELREGAWVDDSVSRRAVLQALGMGAAGLAGLSAGRPGLAEAQAPKRGGTIKIGSFQNIDTLDAHNTTFITACGIHNNIYNGLLRITSTDGKSVDFKPDLAREWEIQGDRVHVFRLHKGVTFHNGDPCTSADIKWNLERVKDKQQAPIHAWKLELLEAIETPDPHTIKLSFAKPYPFLRVAFTGSTGRAGHHPLAARGQGEGQGLRPEPGGNRALQVRGVEGGRLHPARALRGLLGEGRGRRQAALPRQGAHQVHHRALDPGGRAQDRRGGRGQRRVPPVHGRPPQGSQAQRDERGGRQLALHAHEHGQGALLRQEPPQGGGLRASIARRS